ncbi:hypothetical protein EIP86_006809 [Pleurotus ostreatoroseus]|nr:hypothetical protein EIP86_006809 [Pleurotus ostreatoroseus]
MNRFTNGDESQVRLGRKIQDNTEVLSCSLEDVKEQDAILRRDPALTLSIMRYENIRAVSSVTELDRQSRRSVAAYMAVGELVKGGQLPPEKINPWRRLVAAGVVEILVNEVIVNEHPIVQLPPGTPEYQQRILDAKQAPWSDALEILSNASRLPLLQKNRSHDRAYISAVKARWSQMMERLWTAPFNSLRSEETHVFDRMCAGSLFFRAAAIEPSLLDTAYYDLTIPVIARNWAFCGSCTANQSDAYTLGVALSALLQHPVAEVRQYIASHPDTLSRQQLFTQMCEGVGTTPYGTKSNKVKALVDAFGSRFACLNGREVELVVDMAKALLGVPKGQGEVPCIDAFATKLTINETFWSGLFGLLRRIHHGRALDSEEKPTPKSVLLEPIIILLRAFCCVEGDATAELLCTCARAGFFDALDDVVDGLFDPRTQNLRRASEILARLFTAMRDALALCSETQRAELSAQFPRWRTLTTLFFTDAESQQGLQGPPPQNAILPAQWAWQMFNLLSVGCRPKAKCAKRGCNNSGTARCGGCKVIVYCGPECQKAYVVLSFTCRFTLIDHPCGYRDWKSHKRLCYMKGCMDLVYQNTEESEIEDMNELIRQHGSLADKMFHLRKPKSRSPSAAAQQNAPTAPAGLPASTSSDIVSSATIPDISSLSMKDLD